MHPIRRHLSIPLIGSLLALTQAPAPANPIADHPVFAQLVGEWEGSGELVNADDGAKTPVKETWTGKFTDTGNFFITGKRLFDQNEHEFSWEYYANGDLIEGQMKVSEPAIDNRFEVQISEADRTITMKIPLDGNGGLMTIVNTVAEDGQSLSGNVEITDPSGQVTLSGTVTHRKKKSAG